MIIREIKREDNKQIEKIIKDIFHEFDLPLEGTTYVDEETSNVYEAFDKENAVYYVIEINGEVFGGGGIIHLRDFDEDVCELQKMYFSPEIRGKGYGKNLFKKLIETAKSLGYVKCYLESASVLKTAIRMYKKNGFEPLEKPLGNTGHYACGVYMMKHLI